MVNDDPIRLFAQGEMTSAVSTIVLDAGGVRAMDEDTD